MSGDTVTFHPPAPPVRIETPRKATSSTPYWVILQGTQLVDRAQYASLEQARMHAHGFAQQALDQNRLETVRIARVEHSYVIAPHLREIQYEEPDARCAG